MTDATYNKMVRDAFTERDSLRSQLAEAVALLRRYTTDYVWTGETPFKEGYVPMKDVDDTRAFLARFDGANGEGR